uniref:Uncharacterized protein n=1 Tax=Aegilops tauschii TaxID=37682 RepID=R7W9I2_AEGTA
MAKKCFGTIASLLLPCLARPTHTAVSNSAAATGVEDKKNLYVVMGGMGNHPGLPANYERGFTNNDADTFTGHTRKLGGIWRGVGSETEHGGVGGTDSVPFSGYGSSVSSLNHRGARGIRSSLCPHARLDIA